MCLIQFLITAAYSMTDQETVNILSLVIAKSLRVRQMIFECIFLNLNAYNSCPPKAPNSECRTAHTPSTNVIGDAAEVA